MASGREQTDEYHQQFAERIIRALTEGCSFFFLFQAKNGPSWLVNRGPVKGMRATAPDFLNKIVRRL